MSPEARVRATYQWILGRDPTPNELERATRAGTALRLTLIAGLYDSREFATRNEQIRDRVFLEGLYFAVLCRAPTESELQVPLGDLSARLRTAGLS
jgi:hypothetical protein